MRHLNRGHQRYLHFYYENLEDPNPSAKILKMDKNIYHSHSLKKYSLLRENINTHQTNQIKDKEKIKKDKIR